LLFVTEASGYPAKTPALPGSAAECCVLQAVCLYPPGKMEGLGALREGLDRVEVHVSWPGPGSQDFQEPHSSTQRRGVLGQGAQILLSWQTSSGSQRVDPLWVPPRGTEMSL
jgi:hypothetical protein